MHLKIGQSFSMGKIEDEVCSLSLPLIRHIIKVKLYPNHPSMSHWRSEILGWLKDMKRYTTNAKTSSGKIKESTFLNWLIPFTDIEEDILVVVEDYGPSTYSYTQEELQNALKRSIPLILAKEPLPKILEALLG